MSYTLKNIQKNYGETRAFSCLSLEIEKGEKIALIGPSGAGKSTLLNLLGAFEAPSQGSILLNNQQIKNYTNARRLSKHIGIIRQSLDLIDPLPVVHNVLVGKFNEWSTFKSLVSLLFPQEIGEVEEALSTVGIKNKMYTQTKKLSGGEKQRVALARLLLQKPDIILADEPVASLDPARSEAILTLLVKLTDKNHQTLITSLHQIDYALKYFDRIIGLKKGEITLDKNVKDIRPTEIEELYQLENS